MAELRPLERGYAPRVDPFPKHTVPTTLPNKESGITYSVETDSATIDAKMEFNVLKTILNREAYLKRLHTVVRTVGKKFKMEVADMLDLVRASTIDVVDTILKWREVKKDHDAAFIWNGINYLLKVTSDLDYLGDYIAIKRWMGFDLVRNPFCIPYSMEHGLKIHTSNIVDPKHIDKGRSSTDGFIIGGLTKAAMEGRYANKVVQKDDGKDELMQQAYTGKSKSRSSTTDKTTRGVALVGGPPTKTEPDANHSFIFNEDMSKIRQAELIILREEQKFGIHQRDPEGRIVPELQALTRRTAVELRRDDHRPLVEPSKTLTFAPHAEKSDVGLEEPDWTPMVDAGATGGEATEPDEMKYKGPSVTDDVDDHYDHRKKKGKAKIGGVLVPLDQKGSDTRIRKPLKTHLASDMEFDRQRQILTLGQKLQQIEELRKQVDSEKVRIKKEEKTLLKLQRRELRSRDQALPAAGTIELVHSYGSGMGPGSPQKLNPLQASSSSSSSSGGGGGGGEALRVMQVSNMTVGRPEEVNQYGLPVEGGSQAPMTNFASNTTPLLRETVTGIDGFIRTSKSAGNLGTRPGSSMSIPETPGGGGRDLATQQKQLDEDKTKMLQENNSLLLLEKDEKTMQRKHDHFITDQTKINTLKVQERGLTNSEKSRNIERKRRLLTAEEGVRKGPPPEEPSNIYDYYAIRVQTCIRGWLVRQWLKWYIVVSRQATVVLQAAVRGWQGRMKARNKRRCFRAAQIIQANFRGWYTRGTSAAMAKEKNYVKSTLLIQRVWRGVLGKKRAESKRRLDAAAKEAYDCVDERSIIVEDIKELGRRIFYYIEEPDFHEPPPDEVLHLIRLTIMLIQGSRGPLGLVDYNWIQLRSYDEIDGASLSWAQAGKMLNRSERFLRYIRAMAFGPGAKPPRLLTISSDARMLVDAQSSNSKWTKATFDEMGLGGKCCVQLFKWVSSVTEVALRQLEFLTMISSTFPDWLPKLQSVETDMRGKELDIEVNKKCSEVMKMARERGADDQSFLDLLGHEQKVLRRDQGLLRGSYKELRDVMDRMKNDQVSKEVYAIETVDEKIEGAQSELQEDIANFADTLDKANAGDNHARNTLPDIRHKLTSQKLKVQEFETQRKLLATTIASNTNRREEDYRVPHPIVLRGVLAGEAKANYIFCQVRFKTMLKAAGVKHADDLPVELLETVREMGEKELQARQDARRLYVEAEHELLGHNDSRMREQVANEMKEQKAKEQFTPSELELQEERVEDEREARKEFTKSKQYISDNIVYDAPPRPRPVVVALARDLPRYAKAKLMSEVTRMMPGSFVGVDSTEYLGCDFNAMQRVLDTKKNIILQVDPGLTRVTRDSFLKTLETTLMALIPSPFVVIAMGDERNGRNGSDSYHGVDKGDILTLRDGDIKVNLEGMAWAADMLSRPEYLQQFTALSSQIEPPTTMFVFVVEAFFIVLAQKDVFKSPDMMVTAASWRATRRIFQDPISMIAKIRTFTRGKSTLQTRTCVQSYVHHAAWPRLNTKDRQAEGQGLLHVLAYFVESWLQSEQRTHQREGLPLTTLTKSAQKSMQVVVYVTDSVDPEDTVDSKSCSSWRMAANKLVRACLQDMRVMKVVRKIDDVLLNIAVYREDKHVYIEGYDAASSDVYMVTVPVIGVAALLVPNGNAVDQGDIDPPKDSQEMYNMLLNLLRIEKVTKNKSSQRQLVCKRKLTFLRNINRKINGHTVLLKCYEAALGELYFSAYLPEYSSRVTLLFGDDFRLALTSNADTGETGEREVMDGRDARPLLPFCLDRLKLSPSHPMLMARGLDLNTGPKRINPKLMKDLSAEGFQLKVRVRGGAGRILARRVRQFNRIQHLVELRTSAPTKVLEVQLYEPRQRHTMSLRINGYLRKLLLGSVSDDVLCWFDILIKRLRVDWRGEHNLFLDASLCQTTRKICRRRMVVKLEAIDEDNLRVSLTDMERAKTYAGSLTKIEMLKILHWVPPIAQMGNPDAIKKNGEGVVELVTAMDSDLTRADRDSNQRVELDEGSEDIPFEDILSDPQNIKALVNQLQYVLDAKPNMEEVSHYESMPNSPVVFALDPVPSYFEAAGSSAESLSMDLRYSPRLQQSVCDGSLETVLRCRKQKQIVYMEVALNDLALAKARQAEIHLLQDKEAAVEIEPHMQELTDIGTDALATAIKDATEDAASMILEKLEEKETTTNMERELPGLSQQVFEAREAARKRQEAADFKPPQPPDREANAILGTEWEDIFEAGVKCNYREGNVRWQAHVGVKVSRTLAWLADDGTGRRYKFVVYEPNVGGYFEGMVRSHKHLKEVLGLHGQDFLIHTNRAKEMIMFICKNRLDLVTNKISWDGEENPPDAPPYRIEFQSDRLFSNDKVTPINVAEDEDEKANMLKLISVENARGRKIVRLARRVSGLLMQLTVFEIPQNVVEQSGLAVTTISGKPGPPPIKEEGEASPEEKNGAEPNEEGEDAGAEDTEIDMEARLSKHAEKPQLLKSMDDVIAVSNGAPYKPAANENTTSGYAEARKEHETLIKYPPPALRCVGYDPRSRRKVHIMCEPQAVVEVAGGVFSPYLHPDRRKELSRVIVDAMVLVFPEGKPFELLLPWSGAAKDLSTAVVERQGASSKKKVMSERAGADRVLKRPGRLFRSALRISKLELVVSVYSHVVSEVTGDTQLIFNFYTPAASNSAEVVVNKMEQLERVDTTVLQFPEGTMRSAVIRRMCRFFRAEIVVDVLDESKRTLDVVLLAPPKFFVSEYQDVGVPPAGESVRPVGVPTVFFPLDTCGYALHRRGMTLKNENKKQPDRDFLVSVYTKSENEHAERGLVIRLYDRGTSVTSVLHLGPSEMFRICAHVDEPDLLRDLVTAVADAEGVQLDEVETGLKHFTNKGENEERLLKLKNYLMDIVLADLAFKMGPTEDVIPYMKSAPRGLPPS